MTSGIEAFFRKTAGKEVTKESDAAVSRVFASRSNAGLTMWLLWPLLFLHAPLASATDSASSSKNNTIRHRFAPSNVTVLHLDTYTAVTAVTVTAVVAAALTADAAAQPAAARRHVH